MRATGARAAPAHLRRWPSHPHNPATLRACRDAGYPLQSPYRIVQGGPKTAKWLLVERGASQRFMPMLQVRAAVACAGQRSGGCSSRREQTSV